MPIYEYECPSCSQRFEKLVKMSDPNPACPICNAAETRKLVSAASFVLKGSGWYKDHYGLKKGGGESSTSSSSSSSSSTSSTASSSDSKPASTPAPSTPSPAAAK